MIKNPVHSLCHGILPAKRPAPHGRRICLMTASRRAVSDKSFHSPARQAVLVHADQYGYFPGLLTAFFISSESRMSMDETSVCPLF